ncbi:MAG: hypothetical protein EPN72_11735 [Nevskiaceae bacterium]|nr:MAG: hypothetical protein EPN63_01245 [Nevskiaceae bacterium]TBR71860.1 MAG: hypothetical protein EPN72_11735 [Nevskiaceae bacterium]
MPNHKNIHSRTRGPAGSRILVFAASIGLMAGATIPYEQSRAAEPGTGASSLPNPGRGSALLGHSDVAGERSSASTDSVPNWPAYLDRLRKFIDTQASGAAARALANAGQADVDAQKGDLGLNFTGGFTDYPSGAGSGTGNTSSFTDLQQYGEARISWGVLGFFGRRPGRIEFARANAKMAAAQGRVDSLQAQQDTLDDGLAAWAAVHQRDALSRALHYAEKANDQLTDARRSAAASLTGATAEQVTSALQLYNTINSSLAKLPPAASAGPRLPADYSVLPLQAPSPEDIQQAANLSPTVQTHLAASRADTAQARSLWGNGVDVTIYGGYITEKRQTANSLQSGPEAGLTIVVPIGNSDHKKQLAARWRAKADQLQARAATIKQTHALQQLRQQWTTDVSGLQVNEAAMQREATVLHTMHVRAGHSASGKAPEPWTVNLQAAAFWLSVSNVWNARAEWMRDVLTWALYAPGYLQQIRRPGSPNALSLCAPLASCDDTTG